VPFEEWMRLALHDPELGYYGRSVRMGPAGDFATASTLHPALGEAIAALNDHADKLNVRLFSAFDYAVIARR